MGVIKLLCTRIEELQKWFIEHGYNIANLNLGGGLGVDYENPKEHPIANFEGYFDVVNKNLIVRPGQTVHFEPGRAIVAQCGHLISRVLYVKIGQRKKFAILDAGMNDLIRPALYQAHHNIENLVSDKRKMRYDVVGPVCESSDWMGRSRALPAVADEKLAITMAGAYGMSMASRYNSRRLPAEVLIHGEKISLIRRRDTLEDLWANEIVPSDF